METGECEIIEDVKEDIRFKPINHKDLSYDTKSLLVVPVRDSNLTIIAIIYAVNKIGGIFIRDDQTLMETMG